MLKFAYVISLGGDCETAYNIRRYFCFRDAFPFDWWISRPDGIINVINGLNPYNLQYLVEQDAGHGIHHIVSIDRTIAFHHEYARYWQKPYQPVISNWREFIDKPKARFEYLIEKFDKINSKGTDILFVRKGGSALDCDRICEAINERFNLSANKFLFINTEIRKTSEERLTGSVPTGRGWKGDVEAWDSLFCSLQIIIENDKLKKLDIPIEPDGQHERPY